MELKSHIIYIIRISLLFKSHLYGIEITISRLSEVNDIRFKSHLYGIEIELFRQMCARFIRV